MPSPVDMTPSPEERDLAQTILTELLQAPRKRDDRDLRHQLKSLAVTCLSAGVCLDLSDERSQLGQLMARANARARERGWL